MTQRKVYIGSFTSDAGGEGAGITLAAQDSDSGALTLASGVGEGGVLARTPSPSFLAAHPRLPRLYAVNERNQGSVVAYEQGADGSLREIGGGWTGGTSPCHLAVHPSGRFLLAANYGSGTLTVLPLDENGVPGQRTDSVQHTGHGKDPKRQAEPHAHQVRVDPTGQWILATDLGIDAVLAYRLDLSTGRLVRGPVAQTPPGTGPRHLVFGGAPPDDTGPGGSAPEQETETHSGDTSGDTDDDTGSDTGGPARVMVYVAGELNSTVNAFAFDPASGALEPAGVTPSVASDPGPENYPSELALSDDGAFLYVANRGRDVISTVAVSGPAMRPVMDVPTGGAWPRHLAVDGSNLYVANERSHQVTHFRLDTDSGVPAPAEKALDVRSPACVLPVS